MMLEKELEDKMISQLSALPELSACQVIGSRQIGSGLIVDEDDVDSIVAVSTGFRQNDMMQLPMINVAIAIAVTTRLERDPTEQKHENVVEAIADKISEWHWDNTAFTNTFTLTKMGVGALFITGGSGRSRNSTNNTVTDSITINIRGAENRS